MKTPYTDSRLRRAYAIARLRGKLRPEPAEDPNSLPLTLIPRRSAVKEQKSAAKRMTRERQSSSMMNMGQPVRHIPLPRFPSERERMLFAAHERRKSAGWIRG